MSRLLVQQRAKHALERVETLRNDPKATDATRKAYQTYVKGLPATIVTSGLGQAVALCMARSGEGEGNKDAYKYLVRHLEDWLCVACPTGPYRPGQGEMQPDEAKPGLALMKQIVGKNQNNYLLAQAEAILYLDWLKKFANALLVGASEASADRAGEQP